MGTAISIAILTATCYVLLRLIRAPTTNVNMKMALFALITIIFLISNLLQKYLYVN